MYIYFIFLYFHFLCYLYYFILRAHLKILKLIFALYKSINYYYYNSEVEDFFCLDQIWYCYGYLTSGHHFMALATVQCIAAYQYYNFCESKIVC